MSVSAGSATPAAMVFGSCTAICTPARSAFHAALLPDGTEASRSEPKNRSGVGVGVLSRIGPMMRDKKLREVARIAKLDASGRGSGPWRSSVASIRTYLSRTSRSTTHVSVPVYPPALTAASNRPDSSRMGFALRPSWWPPLVQTNYAPRCVEADGHQHIISRSASLSHDKVPLRARSSPRDYSRRAVPLDPLCCGSPAW